MGRTKSPSAASTARTGDRGKPAKSDCQGRNREPPSRNCNYCKSRERLPARVRRNSARIRREGKTSQAYGASSARTRAQSRTARRAARMRNEDGMGGRRAGCMGDSESERLCRHRRSHRPFRDPERTSLCHRVVSGRARGAECVEGDDEWTTGPGLHSCRGPCGARILHAPFLCMHAALQQCGGVGCVFTSPSLRERKGAKAVPFSPSLRARSKAQCCSSPSFLREGKGTGGVLFDVAVVCPTTLVASPAAPRNRAVHSPHEGARPAPAQGGDET